MKKNKILLTGSTGFIGSKVLDLLVRMDCEIYLVLRNTNINLDDFDASNIKKIFYTKNLFTESEEWYQLVCSQVDTIIHLAWYVNHATYLDSDKNYECLYGTYNLAKVAEQSGVTRFIGVGTCLECDSKLGLIPIDGRIYPNTPYGFCKSATFLMLKDLFSKSKVIFIWARVFFIYGEGDSENKLYQYIKNNITRGEPVYIKEGEKVRDFIHVDQAARDIVSLVQASSTSVVNICSGVALKIKDFACAIAKMRGATDLIILRDEKTFSPDVIVGEK